MPDYTARLSSVQALMAEQQVDLLFLPISADLRYLTDSVSRHIDAINRNLEGAARNLYEFSRQIRQNPGLLLGGTPPRDQARIP